MKNIDIDTINSKLQNLQGWKYTNGYIEKDFVFENFTEAIVNMIRIAFEAEALNHHPEWTNVYNKLNIRLSTHDSNGITEKDLILAKRIDNIITLCGK